MRLYLAGPVFTLAEQEFNRALAHCLREKRADLDVILPQVRAEALFERENGFELVFRDCLEMIDKSDVIVSILDGPDADSGTCIELGYAYAKQKPIIGARTDLRSSEDRGLNLMVSHICTSLISTRRGSVSQLAAKILEAISELRSLG